MATIRFPSGIHPRASARMWRPFGNSRD
jgi:hypothetical protein